MSTTLIPLALSGSNVTLLLGDRPVLIDAGTPGDVKALRVKLAEHNIAFNDLAAVVLTHGHTDHTGAAPALVEAGVPMLVGAADADLVRRGVMGRLPPTGPVGSVLRVLFERLVNTPVEPTVVITGKHSLHEYGIDAEAEIVGGHTPGSLIVRAGNTTIVGDLVRGGFLGGRLNPRHPLPHYFAEDSAEVRNALRMVLASGPDRLLVGHGGPLRAEAVRHRFDQVAPAPHSH